MPLLQRQNGLGFGFGAGKEAALRESLGQNGHTPWRKWFVHARHTKIFTDIRLDRDCNRVVKADFVRIASKIAQLAGQNIFDFF